MISLIFASRIKNNPDSNLEGMINSLFRTCTMQELSQIEMIIKYDDDDEFRFDNQKFLLNLPFQVKYVTYSRCTGRSHLHHFYEYLFSLRDKRSKFVLISPDDFVFTRPNWVSQILSYQKKYLLVSTGHCDKEPGPWHTKPRPPIETINYYNMMEWRCIFGNVIPCFSTSFIEVCQNFGWHANIDAWAYLLSMICYQEFKINILEYIDAYFARTEGKGIFNNLNLHDDIFKKGFDNSYNAMQISGSKNCQNLYWFDLVKQQAKNLYLNIKEDGILSEYIV